MINNVKCHIVHNNAGQGIFGFLTYMNCRVVLNRIGCCMQMLLITEEQTESGHFVENNFLFMISIMTLKRIQKLYMAITSFFLCLHFIFCPLLGFICCKQRHSNRVAHRGKKNKTKLDINYVFQRKDQIQRQPEQTSNLHLRLNLSIKFAYMY